MNAIKKTKEVQVKKLLGTSFTLRFQYVLKYSLLVSS